MADPQDEGVILTPEQARQRKRRNVAIALALGALALLFWLLTIFKMGGAGLLNQPG